MDVSTGSASTGWAGEVGAAEALLPDEVEDDGEADEEVDEALLEPTLAVAVLF